MTYGDLKGQVQSAMRDFMHGASARPVLDDHVALWVQQAIYKLDADLLWTRSRVQVASVADQRRYTLADGIHRLLCVTYEGRELLPLTLAEEVAKQEISDSSGTPVYYSWYGQEIALYPTPDTAVASGIELWTIQRPTAMATDADVPTLPVQTHSLLVDYALHQAYRHVGDLEKAQACRAMYAAGMEEERSNLFNSRGVMASRKDSRAV